MANKPNIHAGFENNCLRKLTGNDFGITGKRGSKYRENHPTSGERVTTLNAADKHIVRALQRTDMDATTFEFGGPRTYSYEELLRAVADDAGLKPRLIPVPFAAWHGLAWFAEVPREPAHHPESS
jgi:hypothetical protein